MTQPSSTDHPRLIIRENVSILSTYRTPGATPIFIVSYDNTQKTLEPDSSEFNKLFKAVNEARAMMGAAMIGSGYSD